MGYDFTYGNFKVGDTVKVGPRGLLRVGQTGVITGPGKIFTVSRYDSWYVKFSNGESLFPASELEHV